jgi:hypothetical protein
VRNRKSVTVPTSRSGAVALCLALALVASAVRGNAQTSAIQVDRARAGIPLGSSMTINVSGAIGPLSVQPSFDGVDSSYDPLTHRLLLTGRAPGSGTLALTDRNGNTATITVLVGLPAGTIPADVDVALAGTVAQSFVAARIRDAIERALVRQPGTGLDVHGVTIPATLAPGDKLEAQAGISIDGRGTFVDVSGRTNLHVHVDTVGNLDPAVLFYSDDPEYIGAALSGVLIHGTIDMSAPIRIFAYHVADGAPRRMSLVLRAAVPSHVQMLGTISGASPAFPYIGQQSSARFLAARASGQSAIVAVAANQPYEVPFGLMQPGDLIEAIEDLRVIDGGPVDVAIVTSPGAMPLPPLDGPELAGDSHDRRGVYALTGIAPLDLTFAGGTPEPAPVSVGDGTLLNQRPDGRPLGGDYGVVRPLDLHLANPASTPLNVYLYELTSGAGGATATLWFTGEAAATLIPCIDDSVQPHLVKLFTLAAGETRTVTGAFMTDGAASYPIRFGLSATAPLPAPPGGCAPTPSAGLNPLAQACAAADQARG